MKKERGGKRSNQRIKREQQRSIPRLPAMDTLDLKTRRQTENEKAHQAYSDQIAASRPFARQPWPNHYQDQSSHPKTKRSNGTRRKICRQQFENCIAARPEKIHPNQ